MNTNGKAETNGQEQRALAEHFAHMRREDAAGAPEFPDLATLSAGGAPAASGGTPGRLAGIAAAAVVAAVAVSLLVIERPQPDPGEVYAGIMADNHMVTDQLLLVSEGALPETIEVPQAWELEIDNRGGSMN